MDASPTIALLAFLPPLQLPTDAPEVIEAATWTVAHLASMSDSGVYTSISLRRVVDAASQVGVFHNNTMLTVELQSPHLLDGAETSTHKIIVMQVWRNAGGLELLLLSPRRRELMLAVLDCCYHDSRRALLLLPCPSWRCHNGI